MPTLLPPICLFLSIFYLLLSVKMSVFLATEEMVTYVIQVLIIEKSLVP